MLLADLSASGQQPTTRQASSVASTATILREASSSKPRSFSDPIGRLPGKRPRSADFSRHERFHSRGKTKNCTPFRGQIFLGQPGSAVISWSGSPAKRFLQRVRDRPPDSDGANDWSGAVDATTKIESISSQWILP